MSLFTLMFVVQLRLQLVQMCEGQRVAFTDPANSFLSTIFLYELCTVLVLYGTFNITLWHQYEVPVDLQSVSCASFVILCNIPVKLNSLHDNPAGFLIEDECGFGYVSVE